MNIWSWIAWLVATIALISAGRNPLYLILIWLALQLVFALWSDSGSGYQPIVSPLRFSLFMIFVAALFNALTVHIGETILLVIPGKFPLISGSVTLEAIIYGAINGLVLGSILTAFMLFNLVLPTHALIRLIPRTYYSLAIVISIAVAFLPSTRRQLEMVREAQMIRGRRISGLGDLLALVMPVLVGGLERSVQLAETMTARGFSSQIAEEQSNRYRLVMAIGLLLVLAGWIINWVPPWNKVGTLLLPLGGLIVAGSLWAFGRQSPRTWYHSERWGWLDGLMFLLAVGCLLLSLQAIPGLDYTSLYYSPYPSVSVPTFDSAWGMGVVVVLLPILARLGEKS